VLGNFDGDMERELVKWFIGILSKIKYPKKSCRHKLPPLG